MKNTSLSFDDWKPFECESRRLADVLDISYNNLENINFTTASTALKDLWVLNVANCNISNIPELIEQLGSQVRRLDISGNDLSEFNITDIFTKFPFLFSLKMNHGNLSHIDFGVLQHAYMTKLDISYNALQSINFTSVNFKEMRQLNLEGNDLTEVVGLTKKNVPELEKLDISMNQFSCEYLATFTPQVHNDHLFFNYISDPWKQKHGNDCPQKENAIRQYKSAFGYGYFGSVD